MLIQIELKFVPAQLGQDVVAVSKFPIRMLQTTSNDKAERGDNKEIIQNVAWVKTCS